ncbi:aldo/keto reductase [Microbacterium sp. Sa4CUA7]|uniref:Aldo/keto reductase n=1 Tax=Microbacterium pullorum TaxID=2762236 RepID=A0ABR8S2L2_9MICO|nr:aldo/keto reductase [Microbacterium pullorum]MBD7957713.1 aldo/keto reductase [Microbacterium pullorum]
MIERLGFGAASIGNLYREVSDDDARAVLDAAWDAGIRSFDTAPHYGLGLSEQRLGALLQGKPREGFQLSTKVGRLLEPNPDFSGGMDAANGFAVPDRLVRRFDPSLAGVERSLAESLERLGLDRIDTLFLHDPDVYDLDEGLRLGLPALATLRERGLVDRIGVGVNSVDAAVRAVREGDLDVVMIAGRYTLLEQPARDELLPLCESQGVAVIAVAVFNSGLLAAADPRTAHYDYGDVPAELIERTEALRAGCARHGVALPAAAIQYPLRHVAVEQVVVGTARVSSLQANVEHLRTPIPSALWDDLAAEGLIP